MQKPIRALLFFVAAICLSTQARADGLIYQLPADGSSVTFDLAMTMSGPGEEQKATGTFVVRSVGETEHKGVKGRWIELSMTANLGGRERTITAKLDIPEKQLQAGGQPFANITKFWLKKGNGKARHVTELDGDDAGPLPAFLAGPSKNEKELPAKEIETGIGKLSCTGVSGSHSYKQDGSTFSVEFNSRRHAKAPFGVAATEIKMTRTSASGNEQETITVKLTVAKVGAKAKSGLPDAN